MGVFVGIPFSPDMTLSIPTQPGSLSQKKNTIKGKLWPQSCRVRAVRSQGRHQQQPNCSGFGGGRQPRCAQTPGDGGGHNTHPPMIPQSVFWVFFSPF